MLGLVLWSNPKRRKALIWCEDQRDLAYFDGADEGDNVAQFGTGDTSVVPVVGDMLIFDICSSSEMRRAINVRALANGAVDDLIARLKAAGRRASGADIDALVAESAANKDNVVSFPSGARSRNPAPNLVTVG
ncbi:hypothetical protein J7400_12055 [Shimia sp. R9_2]|uniref:hypothetical protein n=1 Tax=Shimia sp. R9_2 TaxID=2821112 RepID=UPI001ADB8678|nr:hypothetical protein [Shimia sp. R9_2]MBO9397414.1 hypothetical protein [Shimia sp. R9_2]